MERPNPKAAIVARQVVEHPPGGANLVVLVEDEADDVAHLLVGVHVDPIGKELDVAQRHVVEELTALGLVQSASLQSYSHSYMFAFDDCTLQSEQEPVVAVLRVVDTILIREDGPEEGAHFQEVIPISVIAGDAAHLDAEDEADMLRCHLG
jgi:hypothetical protein